MLDICVNGGCYRLGVRPRGQTPGSDPLTIDPLPGSAYEVERNSRELVLRALQAISA